MARGIINLITLCGAFVCISVTAAENQGALQNAFEQWAHRAIKKDHGVSFIITAREQIPEGDQSLCRSSLIPLQEVYRVTSSRRFQLVVPHTHNPVAEDYSMTIVDKVTGRRTHAHLEGHYTGDLMINPQAVYFPQTLTFMGDAVQIFVKMGDLYYRETYRLPYSSPDPQTLKQIAKSFLGTEHGFYGLLARIAKAAVSSSQIETSREKISLWSAFASEIHHRAGAAWKFERKSGRDSTVLFCGTFGHCIIFEPLDADHNGGKVWAGLLTNDDFTGDVWNADYSKVQRIDHLERAHQLVPLP